MSIWRKIMTDNNYTNDITEAAQQVAQRIPTGSPDAAIEDDAKTSLPVSTTHTSAMSLLDRAVASGASIEVLEKLIALQERNDTNEARKAFDRAMADVRVDLPAIIKNREVDFSTAKGRTSYRYEDLSQVTEQLAPVLSKHGLSFRWRTNSETPGSVAVTCIISHRDGHNEETTLSSEVDNSGNKNAIQALGSATSYLQRYTLKAAIGIAASPDTDGRSVGNGNGATISGGQLLKIQNLLAKSESNIQKFCEYAKVSSLIEIKAEDYDRLAKALEKKIKPI